MSMRRAAADDIYIPHPAPDAVIPDDEGKMGAFLSVVKVGFDSWLYASA
jgi:hypothetical protein